MPSSSFLSNSLTLKKITNVQWTRTCTAREPFGLVCWAECGLIPNPKFPMSRRKKPIAPITASKKWECLFCVHNHRLLRDDFFVYCLGLHCTNTLRHLKTVSALTRTVNTLLSLNCAQMIVAACCLSQIALVPVPHFLKKYIHSILHSLSRFLLLFKATPTFASAAWTVTAATVAADTAQCGASH